MEVGKPRLWEKVDELKGHLEAHLSLCDGSNIRHKKT